MVSALASWAQKTRSLLVARSVWGDAEFAEQAELHPAWSANRQLSGVI